MNRDSNEISLTDISTMQVGKDNNYRFINNPDYKTIYKELTYADIESEVPVYKVNLLCEDKEAEKVLKKILKPTILKHLNIISSLSDDNGNSWTLLCKIAKIGKKLLDDSVIVVDADVSESAIKETNFDRITKLYDPDGYCLEKRIAIFVYNLPGDDLLFAKEERMKVLSWFSDAKIDFNKIEEQKTGIYKDWKKAHIKFYDAALKRYLETHIKEFNPCRHTIVNMINECLERHGLPAIKIKD